MSSWHRFTRALVRWPRSKAVSAEVAYAAAAEVHAAVTTIQDALIDQQIGELIWLATIDDAFVDLESSLDKLEALIAAAPNPMPGLAHTHREIAAIWFHSAAGRWRGRDIEGAGDAFGKGKEAWNEMNNEIDRLSAMGHPRA
jgi:hypothetical protein